MSNFKIPVTPLFNGEQFELNGNVISSKGGSSLNIEIAYNSGNYVCDCTFTEIKDAIDEKLDINIKFVGEDGIVSYDQWGIDKVIIATAPDKSSVTFKNGYYKNEQPKYERCWVEESIILDEDYVSGEPTLALVKNIVYSRDYKLKYDANVPTGKTLIGKIPAPKLASEISPYNGEFQIVEQDLAAPTCSIEGFKFKKWYYDADCTSAIAIGDDIQEDTRLYAKWEEDVDGLIFRALEDNVKVSMTGIDSSYKFIYYSTSDAVPEWKDYNTATTYAPNGTANGAQITLAKAGDLVAFKSGSTSDLEHDNTNFVGLDANSRGGASSSRCFSVTGKFGLEGNIMYLIDHTGTSTTLTQNYQFQNLFYRMGPGLSSIAEGFLPATTLTAGCYLGLFGGPSSTGVELELPDNLLPAETVPSSAYEKLFGSIQNSSSGSPDTIGTSRTIKSFPDNMLHAELSTGNRQYFGMFAGCKVPSLPEKFLPSSFCTNSAYYCMFAGITEKEAGCLRTIPANLIQATRMKLHGATRLFYNAKSLVEIPEGFLSTVTTVEESYDQMFQGCTALTTIPETLFDNLTSIDSNEFQYMFQGCTALTTVPANLLKFPGFGNLRRTSCYAMFLGCTALVTAPDIWKHAGTGNDCYTWMFGNCTSLKSIRLHVAQLSPEPLSSTVNVIAGNWMDGVPAGGTLYCPTGCSIGQNGDTYGGTVCTAGVPVGWTKIEE